MVGGLLGPADPAAGDDPVPAVLAVEGPDLDVGPVVDPPAVGSLAAGTVLPLLPGQAGEQVVDGVVDRPAGETVSCRVVAMTWKTSACWSSYRQPLLKP